MMLRQTRPCFSIHCEQPSSTKQAGRCATLWRQLASGCPASAEASGPKRGGTTTPQGGTPRGGPRAVGRVGDGCAASTGRGGRRAGRRRWRRGAVGGAVGGGGWLSRRSGGGRHAGAGGGAGCGGVGRWIGGVCGWCGQRRRGRGGKRCVAGGGAAGGGWWAEAVAAGADTAAGGGGGARG